MSSAWPLVSIVTPSYNLGAFIEETILSIHDQRYPFKEHIIVDRNSTDGTAQIVERHRDKIARFIRELDNGKYDALNKGFAAASGEILAWLNADDKYLPWALETVAHIFQRFPDVEWITTTYPLTWDEQGRAIGCGYLGGFHRRSFMRGGNLPEGSWYARGCIQQESTFFRRSLWERAGGRVDATLTCAGDFELWARFFQHAPLVGVATPLGGFRRRRGQGSVTQAGLCFAEAFEVLRRYGGKPYGPIESAWRRLLGRVVYPQPTRRRPRVFERLLTRMGILYRVPVLAYDPRQRGWRRHYTYIV